MRPKSDYSAWSLCNLERIGIACAHSKNPLVMKNEMTKNGKKL